MKKTFYVLSLLLGMVILVGCSDDDNGNDTPPTPPTPPVETYEGTTETITGNDLEAGEILIKHKMTADKLFIEFEIEADNVSIDWGDDKNETQSNGKKSFEHEYYYPDSVFTIKIKTTNMSAFFISVPLANNYSQKNDIQTLCFGECSSLRSVNISNEYIEQFDISKNTNIEEFLYESINASSSSHVKINLKPNKNLKTLKIKHPTIKELNISELTSIEELGLEIYSFDSEKPFDGLNKLKSVKMNIKSGININIQSNSKLEALSYTTEANKPFSLTDLPALQSVEINNSRISDISVKDLPKLTTFSIDQMVGNNLLFENTPSLRTMKLLNLYSKSTLDLSNTSTDSLILNTYLYVNEIVLNKELKYFNIQKKYSSEQTPENIDFSNCTDLEEIKIEGALKLEQITLGEKSKLKTINISETAVSELSLKNYPQLEYVRIKNSSLMTFDIENLTRLNYLNISYNNLSEETLNNTYSNLPNTTGRITLTNNPGYANSNVELIPENWVVANDY